eukprot:1607863-Pleurochrysis_carterae.AAC.1
MGPEKSRSALRAGCRQVGSKDAGPERPGSVAAVGRVFSAGSPGGCDASPLEVWARDCAGAASDRQG